MAAKLEEETMTLHVHLYRSDVEEIDAQFCREGRRTVGRAKAIRMIVRAWCIQNRRKRNAKPIQYDPSIADALLGDDQSS